jgi:GrpB-like predicted nucleotidyltransferase (UPF0157 family)
LPEHCASPLVTVLYGLIILARQRCLDWQPRIASTCKVSVAELSSVDAVRPRLKALGYEARPDITHDHVPANVIENIGDWKKRFFTSGARNRPTNIHVRRLGAANQRYALLFRDYLRAHSTSAAAYGELKRRLASQLPDLLTYAEVKDPACDLIMIAAEDWARWQGWTPGPTDC